MQRRSTLALDGMCSARNLPVVGAVAECQRASLRSMLKVYLAELGAESEYPYFDLYWSEGGRYPYWIKLSDHIVGFALVRRAQGAIAEMAEFSVSKPWRRAGVGLAAARMLFSAHPGPWKVRTFPLNEASEAFWQKAVPVDAQQTKDGQSSVFHFTVGANV